MGIFNADGRIKPQTQARRWVYSVLAAVLGNDAERHEPGRWFDPGEDADEFDRRRIRKAIEAVKKEMERKAASP